MADDDDDVPLFAPGRFLAQQSAGEVATEQLTDSQHPVGASKGDSGIVRDDVTFDFGLPPSNDERERRGRDEAGAPRRRVRPASESPDGIKERFDQRQLAVLEDLRSDRSPAILVLADRATCDPLFLREVYESLLANKSTVELDLSVSSDQFYHTLHSMENEESFPSIKSSSQFVEAELYQLQPDGRHDRVQGFVMMGPFWSRQIS
jgi:hypothetical protein